MKKLIVLFLFIGMLVNLTGQKASADLHVGQQLDGPGNELISVTGIQHCVNPYQSTDEREFEARYLTENMSCEMKRNLEASLQVLSFSLRLGGVAALCMGISAPFTAALTSLDIGVNVVEFNIRNMRCHDEQASERNRQQIIQAVCEAMARQGYECDPSNL